MKGKYYEYFTFIHQEAAKAFKAYLAARPNLTRDSYLFMQRGTGRLKPNNASVVFRRTIWKLRKAGKLDFKVEKGKPSGIRLYNLRKYFFKEAYKAGHGHIEFWFGYSLE